MSQSGIHLTTGRCSDCSLNADTSLFGYYLYVGNCNCDDPSPQQNPITGQNENVNCRCDVVINNRTSRYECDQVTSISDCVDRLTYCMDPTFNGSDSITEDLQKFCDTPTAPEENFREIGDSNNYIEDGNIIWNIQYQVSRCGSARTNILNDNGNPFTIDQAPNCLPYSKVHMSNKQIDKNNMVCNDGCTMMVENVCDNAKCEPDSLNSNCCISDSVCMNSVLGCDEYRDKGIELCSESNLEPCKNPCSTSINIPKEDPYWKEDICEFFCPRIEVQDFWFGSNNDNTEESSKKDRICSEEYYNLCKLAGCSPDPTCMVDYWNNNSGPKEWSPQHPIVIKK